MLPPKIFTFYDRNQHPFNMTCINQTFTVKGFLKYHQNIKKQTGQYRRISRRKQIYDQCSIITYGSAEMI